MLKKYWKLHTLVATIIVFTLPLAASAQARDLNGFVNILINILQKTVSVIFGIALLGFLWGVAKFVFSAGSEQAVSQGRSVMFYGIITLFVMGAIWGILGLIGNTFF